MWIALSMVALFIGCCWYDGLRASLLIGSEWSNAAADDDTDGLPELAGFLDESLKTDDYQAQHQMGFMTPDHVL
jgi:hypothetical protein